MVYCRNCGAQISDTAVFCHSCGYKLKEHEEAGYKETKVEVSRPAEVSHDISDVIINVSNLQSAVLRLSNKLSTEDIEKISSNLVESLDMLGSIAKSPAIKTPQSRILIERLMLIIERIKKCTDSLQTVGEDKDYHIRVLLDSSNELREKAISLKDEINAIIYRPTRISVVSILLVIIGVLLLLAGLSNIQRIGSPIFLIYLMAGILGIISGIGLWKMRLWAAILGIIAVSILLIESFSFIGILFYGAVLVIILSAMKYYIGVYPRAVVRKDIPKESTAVSGRKVNYLSPLGIAILLLALQGVLYLLFYFIYPLGFFYIKIMRSVGNIVVEGSPPYSWFSTLLSIISYYPLIYGAQESIYAFLLWRGSGGAYKWAKRSASWSVGIAIILYLLFVWLRGQTLILNLMPFFFDSVVYLLSLYTLPYTILLGGSPSLRDLSAIALNGLVAFTIYNIAVWVVLYSSRKSMGGNE